MSPRADETTSNYQARYRDLLRARNEWTIHDRAEDAPPADLLVRPVPDDVELPAGATAIFHGRKYTAYVIAR